MQIDGKAIARELLDEVRVEVASLERTLTLTAVTCAPRFETKKYLEMKKRKAASVGIALNVLELPPESTTADVVTSVVAVASASDGIVVQLPLPERIDRDAVLRAVAVAKDPDGFAYGVHEESCLPPVVGAIDVIATRSGIEWSGANVVILGRGRLVGAPAAIYAATNGADVTVMIEETFNQDVLRAADILITGIGRPHFVTSDMVKAGMVVFDAGTSEDGGELVGDVDPVVAETATVFTPVPGGIGPITIAYLLKNLVQLARQ